MSTALDARDKISEARSLLNAIFYIAFDLDDRGHVEAIQRVAQNARQTLDEASEILKGKAA